VTETRDFVRSQLLSGSDLRDLILNIEVPETVKKQYDAIRLCFRENWEVENL
jgi:hypothetical protein